MYYPSWRDKLDRFRQNWKEDARVREMWDKTGQCGFYYLLSSQLFIIYLSYLKKDSKQQSLFNKYVLFPRYKYFISCNDQHAPESIVLLTSAVHRTGRHCK